MLLSVLYGGFSRMSHNILSGVVTMVLAPFVGYVVHVGSHRYDFKRELYDRFESVSNPLQLMCINLLSSYLNFHNNIHHDHTKSDQWVFFWIEAMQNIHFQAIGLIVINLIALNRVLNNSVIALWGLVYTTMHLINFPIFTSETHEQHHVDRYTNYGPHVFDIVFDTASPVTNTIHNINNDTYNNGAINVVAVTVLIILYKTKSTILINRFMLFK